MFSVIFKQLCIHKSAVVWCVIRISVRFKMLNFSENVFFFRNISKCKINIVAYSLLRYGNPNTSVLLKAIRAQQFKVI